MSGHSKWANIKHRKESQDYKRGQVFSKFARLIAIAVKEGNSADPESNSRLKFVIERARVENVPKENIQRAVENAAKKKEAMEEVSLEGYGPGGIAILIEAITDNRQRTIQELKNIFQKNGGYVVEPGSVAFQFEKKGLIELENPKDETKTLELIDLGAEEFEEEGEVLTVWVSPADLDEFKKRATETGFQIKKVDLLMKPRNLLRIDDPQKGKSALSLLNFLDDHDDVQRVFSNVDFPEEMMNELLN